MRINLITALLISICIFNGMSQEKLSLRIKDNVPEFGRIKLNNVFNKVSVSDTSNECNIVLIDGSKIKNVCLVSPEDSMFAFIKNGIKKDLPVSKLHNVTFEKHDFWTGFTIGTATSLVFWELLGIAASKNESSAMAWGLVLGLICAPPVGLIFGMVAEFSGKDEVYNFSTINPSSRVLRLKKIISEHR